MSIHPASRRSKPIITGLVCLVLVVLNFLLQIWTNPSYQGMSVDSGIFAYCGERILEGDLLYRDCYDNKPPLVYYLNGAALVLTGGHPGGIWLFQAVWMAGTLVAFFLILRRIWGAWPAGISALIFTFSVLFPEYYQEGNYTETYVLLALVLQMGALFGALSTGKKRYLVATGLLTAAAFLLKPTYIALGACSAAVIFYTALRQGPFLSGLRRAALRGLWMLAGLSAPLLLTALYWSARGGLDDLWFAVITHNRQYVAEGYQTWLIKETFLKFLFSQPLAFLFALGLVAGGVTLFENWRDLLPRWRQPAGGPVLETETAARGWLTLTLLLSIPLEIFLIALSGRGFGHYYLVPIPAMAAASAVLFYTVQKNLRPLNSLAITAGALLVVLGIPWWNNIRIAEAPQPGAWTTFWSRSWIASYPLSELEQYLLDHSQSDESVLVWATHPSLNLVTGRRSPTRYVYPLHVLKPTPTGSTGFAELIGELQADPPALIVAQQASSVGLPDFWSEDGSICPGCSTEARQGMLDLKAYINDHYEFGIQIFDWYIYRRTG